MLSDNLLYYGDNLDVLRRHVKDESVDLVYLDPPLGSNQDYPGAPGLFAERDGTRAAAEIKAVGWAESSSPTIWRSRFHEGWDSKIRPTLRRWDRAAAEAFAAVVEAGGPVSQVMQAFRTFLGENPGAPDSLVSAAFPTDNN